MKYSYLSYHLVIIIVLSAHSLSMTGQNNTKSPYSALGIGLLQHRGFGYTQGMGGTGIGIRSNNYLNILNPASYSAIDSGSVHFDIGTHLDYSIIEDASGKQDYLNGNLSYIALGFPIWKKWSAGLSLFPVSNVGYEINTSRIIEGTTVPYQISGNGTGGLSQVNFVNSIEIFKFLSVGISAGYTFGSLDVSREILFGEEAIVVDIDEKRKYHGWDFELGLQLTQDFSNGNQLTIGGMYRPSSNLHGHSTYDIYSGSDSLIQAENTLGSLVIPRKVGGGFSFLWKEKVLWAADYSHTFWSATSDDYQDNMVISSGLEWLPDKDNYQDYLSRISYRIGARYESGYLIINNHPVQKYVGTIGVGLPFRNMKNRFNLTFEIGKQGTIKHSLIQENYYRFSLHVNLQDIWFRKYKYD